MLLKILLKIWPSLIPVTLYVTFIILQSLLAKYLLSKKKDYIEGEFKDVTNSGSKNKKSGKKENIGHFSLKNPRLIMVIYLSLITLILSLLFTAFTAKVNDGKYIPAKNEAGKIIPAKVE